jgi:hypothetical protein
MRGSTKGVHREMDDEVVVVAMLMMIVETG